MGNTKTSYLISKSYKYIPLRTDRKTVETVCIMQIN